jgi:hypothetical protein
VAALEADVTGFDPSGTRFFGQEDSQSSLASLLHSDNDVSSMLDTDSLKQSSNGPTPQRISGDCHFLDDTTDEVKVQWLKDIFHDIAEDDIRYRLSQCERDITRTLDELLNWSFLAQNELEGLSVFPKGVDGFVQSKHQARNRRGKGKGKRQMRSNDPTRSGEVTSSGSDMSARPHNPWTSTADDIEFIRERTNYEAQKIRSIYTTQQKSLSRTIRAMATNEANRFEPSRKLDCSYQTQLAELETDFPKIQSSALLGLMEISGRNVVAVRELAAAMVTSHELKTTGALEIVTRYAPIDIGSDYETDRSCSSNARMPLSHTKAQDLAIEKAAAANTAFAQATKASKKARSDHHMGGAAAYYSALARENVAVARDLSSQAAEGFVLSQSDRSMLDLHGVSVADAVQIARVQVARWWDDLGDAKHVPGGGGPAREGYRVVTGVGRHSKGGAPQIGPAVSRMLVKEGWKVTVGQGEILVTGRMRRVPHRR